MNAHIKSEECNIKLEDDLVPIGGIKIEPLDIKCDKMTEAEDCDSFPEHIDIKQEIEPISHHAASIKNVSEVDGIQEPFYKLLEDYEKKLQGEQKYGDDHVTNIVTDLCETELQEEKCDYIDDHVGENANNAYENTFLEHTNASKCTQIADKCFKCGICNKSFGWKGHLTRHMYVHTGEKPFTCTSCSKSFSDRSNLVKHIRIHSNYKPYSCTFCSKSFSDKNNLSAHTRIHTNEKPFSCHFCSRSFSDKSSLNRHKRIHTNEKPYTCHFCTKSFCEKRHLTEHIRTHTKEKPYSCYICQKPFPRKNSLAQHIRTHTKEKPFSCTFCSKSFCDRSSLIRHKHSLHK